MISSIQGNASWPPAGHASQISSPEARHEVENDGDSDDVAGSRIATASRNFPEHLGNRINTLA